MIIYKVYSVNMGGETYSEFYYTKETLAKKSYDFMTTTNQADYEEWYLEEIEVVEE